MKNIFITKVVSVLFASLLLSGQVQAHQDRLMISVREGIVIGVSASSPVLATFLCVMAEFDYGTDRYPLSCSPTHAALEISQSFDKETIAAANEDAIDFLMTDGEVEPSATLSTAVDALSKQEAFSHLSEKEKAMLIVMLNR